MKRIYLDYNATTPIHREVADFMQPYLTSHFGNPSSTHGFGSETKKAVENARSQVAKLLECNPDEVIFTSGGTESNNLAIKGYALAHRKKGNHIIVSSIEHPSVIEVTRYLEKNGFTVTYLPVDTNGMVNPEDLVRNITSQTILISIMHANNEVGTIQPIREISVIARKNEIGFHTDAAQSIGKIDVNVKDMGVDLLSIAAHKFYGPKGIGALFIKRGTSIEKLIHGADHEMNLRAGTENVLEIVGLGKACELAARDLVPVQSHVASMRNRLEEKLVEAIPSIKINGHPELRLPNTTNIGFPGIEANTLLSGIKDIAASAGAACHSDSEDRSSVLMAMDVPVEYRMGTIRFSTGKDTTEDEIDKAVKQIIRMFNELGSKTGSSSEIINTGSDVKLTQYTHGMGCACKIPQQDLATILKNLPPPSDKKILIGYQTSDDAAVYRIDKQTAIVQTVDFFTPVVNDPYDFGRIAAANALSDIYAMGANPLFALNIVAFPQHRLPLSVLEEILKGAESKVSEADISILGGHTIEDSEPKFGLAVTGIVHPEKILTNSGGQTGDQIILTKPLGTGILSSAIKQNLLDKETESIAVETMAKLNRSAASLIKDFSVSACTDVTGFGLLGHLSEITTSSQVDAEVFVNQVPVLPKVRELAAANVFPGGSIKNLEYITNRTTWDHKISQIDKMILSDAQTSGGLIICVPEPEGEKLILDLKQMGISSATIIGKLVRKGTGNIMVRNV